MIHILEKVAFVLVGFGFGGLMLYQFWRACFKLSLFDMSGRFVASFCIACIGGGAIAWTVISLFLS